MGEIARQAITIDPDFADIWGELEGESFDGLMEEIKTDGIRDSLILWKQNGKNILVDGHNRLRIAKELHINAIPVEWKEFQDKAEASMWIVTHQLSRRNLNDYERSVKALDLKQMIAEKAKGRMLFGKENPEQKSAQGKTNDELAKIAGVSHDTIHKVEVIEKNADSETKELLKDGKMSINRAYKMVKPEKPSVPKKPKPVEEYQPIDSDKEAEKIQHEQKVRNTRQTIRTIIASAQKLCDGDIAGFDKVFSKKDMESALNEIGIMVKEAERIAEIGRKAIKEIGGER